MASPTFPMQCIYQGKRSDFAYNVVVKYLKQREICYMCTDKAIYVPNDFEAKSEIIDWNVKGKVLFECDVYPLNCGSKSEFFLRALFKYLSMANVLFEVSADYLYVSKGTNMAGIFE